MPDTVYLEEGDWMKLRVQSDTFCASHGLVLWYLQRNCMWPLLGDLLNHVVKVRPLSTRFSTPISREISLVALGTLG